MDESVRIFDTERENAEEQGHKWVPTANSDLSPQSSDVAQLIDVPFGFQMELGEALRHNRLRLQYQPQFETHGGQGCGVEALARWTRRNGESVPPSVFVRLAEQTGMIHSLGAWVLQSACAAASAWPSFSAPLTTLSVNVSALQFDEAFCGVIEQVLNQSGLPAKRLELEVTESAFIANPERAIEYLRAWKQLGVRIAMDDFGVGHSSLSRLSDLPVDRLKVDQSLVHRMTLDRKSAAIMRLIVSLGAELDMQVIAEGVETEEQLQMLTDLGCPQVQGYLLGKPMSPERAQAALSTVWGDRSAPTPARVANHVRESRGIDCGVPLSGGGIAAARGAVATQRVRRDALFQHGLANSGAGRA